jgi:vitamin B12 transporter
MLKGFKTIKFLLLFLSVGLGQYTFAQKNVTLDAVTVVGVKPERFMVGYAIQELDSSLLVQYQNASLSQVLQSTSFAHVKSYGKANIASMSVRGTSANHTAVLWNGININFPSLGSLDLNTTPMAGFEGVKLQLGASASVVGTDAIGGSILLDSRPNTQQNYQHFQAKVSAETNENYNAQVSFKETIALKNNKSLYTKTLLYGANNSYWYKEKPRSLYNYEQASMLQQGITQDLLWTLANNKSLSLNFWGTNSNAYLLQNDTLSQELTQTKALRSLLTYQSKNTTLRLAHTNDFTGYSKGLFGAVSKSNINRLLIRAERQLPWWKNGFGKLGAEAVTITAQLDGYGPNKKTEQRADFYGLFRQAFGRNLLASFTIRQALVTGYNPPLAPALGLEYSLVRSTKNQVKLLGTASKAYRVPTLNERFWEVLGNPDIKPETSHSAELATHWTHKANNSSFVSLELRGFYNLIDQWVYWNPAKNYRVENLQLVQTKGLETNLHWNQKMGPFSVNQHFSHSLTHAWQKRAYSANWADVLGKQLIQVPKNMVSHQATVLYKQWSVSLQQRVTGVRHITFDHSGFPFPSFYMANIFVQKAWQHKQRQYFTAIQCLNCSDTEYPSVKRTAMPGRSIRLELSIDLVKKHK